MMEMIEGLMKNDLKEALIEKDNNHYSILLRMKDRPTAC